MPHFRTPFEETAEIIAAVRNISVDRARAAVITETLQWIDTNQSNADQRIAFATALTAASEPIQATASYHLDSADRARANRDTGTSLRIAATAIADTARYNTIHASSDAPF